MAGILQPLLTIQFLFSKLPLNPSRAQIKRATFMMPHLNYLQSIISLGEHNPQLANWLASPYHILSFHFRKPSTSGGRKPSRQPPGVLQLRRRMRVGRSFPMGGGCMTDQFIRASRRPSSACHWVLKDCGELLPLTEERR